LIEHSEIHVSCGCGFRFGADAFTQKIERWGNAPSGQLLRCAHGFFDSLAGDEAGGKLPGQPVAPNEIENPALFREPEQTLSRNQKSTSERVLENSTDSICIHQH
jgi:hypothetical protein